MTSDTETNWPLITLIYIATITAATHLGKSPPALPSIMEELGVSLVAAGWIVSIVGLVGATGGIAAGLLGDRFGHARLIKFALIGFVIGGTAGAFTETATMLLISRAVEGGAYICAAVASPSLIAGLASNRDRSLAISIYSTSVPMGMTIAVLIAPQILELGGWRGLWLAVAGLSAVMFVLIAIFVRPGQAQRAARSQSFLRDAWLTISTPGPNILAVGFMTYTAQWTAVMVWLPTFIVDQRDASLGLAALLTAPVIAMNIGGNWFGGVLMHRGAPRWLLMMVGTSVMGLCALGFFPEVLPDPVRYGLCLAFSFFGGMQPASLAAGGPVHAPSPAQLGTTNGYWLQGSQVGQLLGAPAVAFVVTTTGGWAAVGPALVIGTVINIALAQWLRKLEAGNP